MSQFPRRGGSALFVAAALLTTAIPAQAQSTTVAPDSAVLLRMAQADVPDDPIPPLPIQKKPVVKPAVKPAATAPKPATATAPKPAAAASVKQPVAATAAKPLAATAPKVAKATVAKVSPEAKRAVSIAALTAQDSVPPHEHESIAVPPSECPGNPDAIGLSRIIKVDTTGGFYVGQTYHTKMPLLEPKEVILTFDDGPLPARTDRVLAALKHECVKATFFMIGQMARAYPEEARKVALAGHTIGYHTMTHTYQLKNWPLDKSQAEIVGGWKAVDLAVYGHAGDTPSSVFFRYPGLFNSRVVNQWFNKINMGVFAIDAAGNDWLKGYINTVDAPNVMNRALAELERNNGGILLLHDIKESSSNAVAPLLVELKKRGFKIVHIEPKQAPPPVATGPVQAGVIDTAPAPIGDRSISGFDTGRQLAQDKLGKTLNSTSAPLPAYQPKPAAASTPTPQPKPAATPAPLLEQPVDPTTTQSITPRPGPSTQLQSKDDGWFASTANTFRGVATAIGLW